MSSAVPALRRQWIPIAGGSCDVRMGYGALEQASAVFRAAVGHPRRCIVLIRSSCDEGLCELMRRQLVDAGYEVCWYQLADDAPRTLDEAHRIAMAFAQHRITGDDLCCAVGDADVLSLASWVCGMWCGQTNLVALPVDEIALLEGALIPRSLDVSGLAEMVAAKSSVRHVLLDYDMVLSDYDDEASRYARSLMVAAAMSGSERVFSELWDRTDAISQGDEDAYVTQLLATAKSRGQAVSSTAVAIRQSLSYGQNFARALMRITDGQYPKSALVAEGMRFAARLSVGLEKLLVDDMLAQDELLEALGVGTFLCDVAPQDLVNALKQELFLRSNRFMLLVPFAIGRVRLATIPDDLLIEHVTAWCGAHATS